MKLDRTSLAVRHVMTRDELRLPLHGLLVDRERTVATDGHRLAVVAHADGEELETPTFIPIDVVESIAQSKADLSLTFADGVAVLARDQVNGFEQTWRFASATPKFPDIDPVIPKGPVLFETSLDPRYLAGAAKFFNEVGGKAHWNSGLVLRLRGEQSVVEITRHGAERARYFLMPMRHDGCDRAPTEARVWARAEAAINELAKEHPSEHLTAALAELLAAKRGAA